MEQVQPLSRPFPWRLATLVASAVALAILAGLVLTRRPAQTRPVSDTGRVPTRQAVTPLRPRSRLSVLVLNGNGASGAAGTEATTILARGYRHAIPSDAPQLDYARSLVLFRPGWQREAERLARDVKIPTVATLDGRVAPEYAHVPLIVILGAN
ncbi:MAG: LytR family transcriptional regulator [Actinobacteria bacterium]|nr:MAG: LytR family transcriptional regulator [Actinomycetota bacterium]